jgi:hypothetical protein
MINRRYDGRAPCFARQSLQQVLEKKSHEFARLLLAKADMRVDKIRRIGPTESTVERGFRPFDPKSSV